MLYFQALVGSWDKFNSRGHKFDGLVILFLEGEREANIIIQEGFYESILNSPEIIKQETPLFSTYNVPQSKCFSYVMSFILLTHEFNIIILIYR